MANFKKEKCYSLTPALQVAHPSGSDTLMFRRVGEIFSKTQIEMIKHLITFGNANVTPTKKRSNSKDFISLRQQNCI